MWSWLENLKERPVDYEAVWLFLMQCAVVAKTLIEFEFVAKAWICYESLNSISLKWDLIFPLLSASLRSWIEEERRETEISSVILIRLAWIKHIVVAKTNNKHEVVVKASIFIAFGYEKNNPARRAGEKK